MFGIDEEETQEEFEVVKIIDILGSGECYFPYSRCHHMAKPIEFVGDEVQWRSIVFYCIYVVKEFDFYRLKFRALENFGPELDDANGEPIGGYAEELPLQVLEKLSEWLGLYVGLKEMERSLLE